MSKIKEQARQLVDLSLKNGRVLEVGATSPLQQATDRGDKRKAATQELVNKINLKSRSRSPSPVVRLFFEDGLVPGFYVRFAFGDPFVDKEAYDSGTAYIYLSEHFYSLVSEVADSLGYDVSWNNTGTSGWLTPK